MSVTVTNAAQLRDALQSARYVKSPVGICNYGSHEGLSIAGLNQSIGTDNIFNGGQHGVLLQG